MKHDTDVAIVGAGPGGTGCALFLAQKGIRTTLIEKESFPRYHIGESMTGEVGNVLRKLGFEEEMQKRGYPVKHGVRVLSPTGKNSFWVPVMRRDPEAGLQKATTWQVRRSEFDGFMLDAARENAAETIQGEAVGVLGDGNEVTGVRVRTESGQEHEIRSRVVVDASGPAAFLSRSGVIGAKQRGNYANQVAIYSQVRGAVRDPGEDGGNTLIFYEKPNHWSWFIPLDDEVVSIGVVVPNDYFKAQRISKDEFLRSELKTLNPDLARRVEGVEFVEETRASSNYSYEIDHYTGPGYMCAGDSHRFVDPVFSFGLHFALKEGEFAAEHIERHFAGEGNGGNGSNPFKEYEEYTTLGMDRIQDLIDAFWERPTQFALIVHQKFREDSIDLFAGRIYEDKPSPGMIAIRQVLAKARGLPIPTA